MVEKVEPVTSVNNWGETVTSHPAFGMVQVGRIHSNGITLHASDLRHHEVIELRFYEGETEERDGSVRHRAKTRRPILEVQLSPAQWAAMITSFGLGEGVPCTLLTKTDGNRVSLPNIKPTESTRQRFDRQIVDATQRQIAKLMECKDELGALVAKGKVGKKELAELHHTLSAHLNNLPANLAYSTTLVQEAMDKVVAEGKAELEATALGVATRLGLKEINRLVELEDKSDEDNRPV